jgi:hypothetical protein
VNITGQFAFGCSSQVKINDWFQGLQDIAANVTACAYGVNAPLTAPNGVETEVQIIGGQFYTTSSTVNIANAQTALPPSAAPYGFAGLEISGGQMAAKTGNVINVAGAQGKITGEIISCAAVSGQVGISIGTTFGQGVEAVANQINSCDTGISVSAASQAPVPLKFNRLNNSVTADYAINTSARGVYVNDDMPRSLSNINAQVPCNASTIFSQVWQDDSLAPTYHGAPTSGGNVLISLKCNGGGWAND